MKKEPSTAIRLAKACSQLMALGAATSVCVSGIYFYKFAPGHWFELSSSQEVWSAYGTFVGGVLGPSFSFLAFIAVVFTVVLQARQLDTLKDQAEFEEVQRVMSGIAARIDPLLAASVEHDSVIPLPLSTYLAKLGSRALGDPNAQPMWNDALDIIKRSVAVSATPLDIELNNLSWCLRRYRDIGGSGTVLDYYRFRYGPYVAWLAALDLMTSEIALEVFDVKMMQAALTPEPSKQAGGPNE